MVVRSAVVAVAAAARCWLPSASNQPGSDHSCFESGNSQKLQDLTRSAWLQFVCGQAAASQVDCDVYNLAALTWQHAPLPASGPRLGARILSASVGGRLVILDSQQFQSAWMLDQSSWQWTVQPLVNAPSDAQTCIELNQFAPLVTPNSLALLSRTHVWTLDLGTWTWLATLSWPARDTDAEGSNPAACYSAASNAIYLYGADDRQHRLSLATGWWDQTPALRPPLPLTTSLAAAVLSDRVVLWGDSTFDQLSLAEPGLWSLQPTSASAILADRARGRSLIAWGDWLVAYGGTPASSEAWLIDPRNMSALVSGQCGSPAPARSGHTASNWQDGMLVFGGRDETQRVVAAPMHLNLTSGCWSAVMDQGASPPPRY